METYTRHYRLIGPIGITWSTIRNQQRKTKMRKAVISGIMAAAVTGAAIGGYASHTYTPANCSSPTANSGTTMAVDSQGNGSIPFNGTGTEMFCISGLWLIVPPHSDFTVNQ